MRRDLPALAADLRTLLSRFKRRLREQAGVSELSDSQICVLRHLEREGAATVTALARLERVRPQSMGATVAALEALGLIAGAPDPSDGRQTILSLTAACKERMKAARAARDDWLVRRLRTHLSPHEHARLADALELIKRLIDS